MPENSQFEQQLFRTLMRDCYEFQRNNTDYLRFKISPAERFKTRIREMFLLLARRKGFSRKHFNVEEAAQTLAYTFKNLDKLRKFNDLLKDDYSKRLLIELLKFRILGSKHVRLPLNNKQYWEAYRSVDKKFLKERNSFKTSWNWSLNHYQLPGKNRSFEIHVTPLGVLNTFLLEQYAYRKGDTVIEAESGDVVIDAGACWGDTMLYFADKVGSQGKVYCFEFDADNLRILQSNLDLNPSLASSIKVIQKALWDKSGEVIDYLGNGPGTSLIHTDGQQAQQVSTLTIDGLVDEENLEKVDFIKMDIEGAELKALRGAEQTIRAFRPKLAISLYHNEDDFIVIPEYLNELDLGYEFFLDHFTIHREETVLFARPRPR
jgi:FkbM family methyltransferase